MELVKLTTMKGWNMQQLANHSGVSMATISRIIGGKSCKAGTAVNIAKALETDFETLIIQ